MSDTHIISGFATDDADIRATQNRSRYVQFTLASNVYDGREKKQVPVYYRFTLWEEANPSLFQFAGKWVKKGRPIEAVGSDLRVGTYDKRDGTVGTNINLKLDAVHFLPKAQGGDNEKYGGQRRAVKKEEVAEALDADTLMSRPSDGGENEENVPF